MRPLLDECVPRRLKRELQATKSKRSRRLGGQVSRMARYFVWLTGCFFLTVDQGIQYQQNLTGLRIGVLIMVAPSNDICYAAD